MLGGKQQINQLDYYLQFEALSEICPDFLKQEFSKKWNLLLP